MVFTVPDIGGASALEGTSGQVDDAWRALLAAAAPLGAADLAVADTIGVFGGLGFADRYADPVEAQDQCISASELFASMCRHRGIEAGTVTGFLWAHVPPFTGHVIVCGHTAVRVATSVGPFAIDWTARQFDPVAPVPLIVGLAGWQAFWRGSEKEG